MFQLLNVFKSLKLCYPIFFLVFIFYLYQALGGWNAKLGWSSASVAAACSWGLAELGNKKKSKLNWLVLGSVGWLELWTVEYQLFNFWIPFCFHKYLWCPKSYRICFELCRDISIRKKNHYFVVEQFRKYHLQIFF